jgi:hypothetical protein
MLVETPSRKWRRRMRVSAWIAGSSLLVGAIIMLVPQPASYAPPSPPGGQAASPPIDIALATLAISLMTCVVSTLGDAPGVARRPQGRAGAGIQVPAERSEELRGGEGDG